MVQQSQQRSSLGYIVALSGGILAMLAFLVFPYVSFGFFGSFTAIQLANGIAGHSFPSLWLEFLAALLIVGLSCFSLYKKDGNAASAIAISGLSGITILVLGFTYIQQSTQQDFLGGSIASYYSTGLWFYLAGIIVALVGGILQLNTLSQSQIPRQQLPPFQQSQRPNGPPSPLP